MWLVSPAKYEALCGVASGLAHLDDKVRDGEGDGVHEAKPPLADGDVCYEEGGERDVGTLGEAGEEKFDHVTDSDSKWPHPFIPAFVLGFRELVHHFRGKEMRELVEGALGEETKCRLMVGNGFKQPEGVLLVVLQFGGQEGGGEGSGSDRLAEEPQPSRLLA